MGEIYVSHLVVWLKWKKISRIEIWFQSQPTKKFVNWNLNKYGQSQSIYTLLMFPFFLCVLIVMSKHRNPIHHPILVQDVTAGRRECYIPNTLFYLHQKNEKQDLNSKETKSEGIFLMLWQLFQFIIINWREKKTCQMFRKETGSAQLCKQLSHILIISI